MTLTRLSLANPIAVLAGILLVSIFGLVSLFRLPIQLTPEIEEPGITITTTWRAASPNEIESDVIEPQEEVLRGLPGMTELLSKAQQGRGEINITFTVDMDMRRALLEVINRLNQVPSYPDDVDEPVISSVGADARAIAWFIIKPQQGNTNAIRGYKDYVEELVQARFERIPGVARSEVYGGSNEEIRITFDPYKAAALDIQLPAVAQLFEASKDVSGGFKDVGKREYSIRFAGKYDVEQLQEMILVWRDKRPVYLRDIATVEKSMEDKNGFVITSGSPSIAVNAQRETGINVLQVMRELKIAAAELQAGPLARAGLTIEQVYDETTYIHRAIKLLRNNLGLGICLAIMILWLFLMVFKTTLVIAASIPLCLLASFVLMDLTGRTLNVISLAGLAFSVGMVLDASIIILENIIRLRERAYSPDEASDAGTSQVWGALIASTTTTVAIFCPIIFLREESGQLFADLAITITAAICISLLTAITVVPTAAKFLLKDKKSIDPYTRIWDKITNLILSLTDRATHRLLWIVLLTSIPLSLSYILKPKADYLPNGNRNLGFAFILPPPGASIEQIEQEMGYRIAQNIAPYIEGTADPQVRHYFFVAISQGVFMGAQAKYDREVDQLIPLMNTVIQGIPDTIAFARQASLFQGFGSGRSIDINIQGNDIEAILRASLSAFTLIPQKLPGANTRPLPGLTLAQPELRLIPNERRIGEAGWSRSALARFAYTLGDGLYIGDYFDGERTIDMVLRTTRWDTLEDLGAIPLATPYSGVLPLGELVEIARTAGPEEIRRINKRRTITLEVSPPPEISLEQALDIIKRDIVPTIMAQLPEDGDIQYTGSADKLAAALYSMLGSFLLAIAILYLLMSALLRSFLDSLLIMLSIPLATVGGVLMLRLINLFTFQSMDLLTMIGFVILLGLVVNNAILLVYQTRTAERSGEPRRQAVKNAIRLRIRPIMMSTLTSIFGMLPLLLIPGAGAELYRGLASVIVGGMLISTIFILVLLPCLLRLGERQA